MTYSVDFSADWQHVDGVESASYTSADGLTTVATIHVRRSTLSKADYAGGEFGYVPTDLPLIVWKDGLDATVPEIDGTIVLGGVTYTVVGFANRGDLSQYRLVVRRQA